VIDGFATLADDGAGVMVCATEHAAKSRYAVRKEVIIVEVHDIVQLSEPADECSQSRAGATS
jgi:hypothetical protein